MNLDESGYRRDFGLDSQDGERIKKALEVALDVRKFEIGLYWQRATYFWTLIAASFGGYFLILGSEHLVDKEYLSLIVACIGLIFTWAWYLVIRGSKQWQENWENHVDMLEDSVTGPLFKTKLSRTPDKPFIDKVVGPGHFSPSRVNALVSIYTLIIWIALIIHSLPEFNFDLPLSPKHCIVFGVTIVFVLMMWCFGKSFRGSYKHLARKSKTGIADWKGHL